MDGWRHTNKGMVIGQKRDGDWGEVTVTVTNSEVEILNMLKLPWHAQGMGWWATVSPVCMQTSSDSPRTRTFAQYLTTAGYTASSMNGLLNTKCTETETSPDELNILHSYVALEASME